jgi:predicted NACHT family NTPase
VEELNRNYGVPPRTGRGWLRDERLLLLLDGLDEVRADRRRGCLAAINAFVHDSGFTPIAVTCRAAEYWAMPERLELGLAFEVESLTPEQVIDFFARSDSTRRWPRLGSWCSAIRCSSSWRRRL